MDAVPGVASAWRTARVFHSAKSVAWLALPRVLRAHGWEMSAEFVYARCVKFVAVGVVVGPRAMLAPVVAVVDVNRALPENVRALDVLERGGQGTVYRGTVDGLPAAIKLYTTHPYELRVDREIDALRRVTSRTIARLLWSGEVRFGTETVRVVATQMIAGAPLDKVHRSAALLRSTRCQSGDEPVREPRYVSVVRGDCVARL